MEAGCREESCSLRAAVLSAKKESLSCSGAGCMETQACESTSPLSVRASALFGGSLRCLQLRGRLAVAGDGCEPSPVGSLDGQIVLYRRGGCSFASKATNAQHGGAAAVLLFDDMSDSLFMSADVAGASVEIPVLWVTPTTANALKSMHSDHQARVFQSRAS